MLAQSLASPPNIVGRPRGCARKFVEGPASSRWMHRKADEGDIPGRISTEENAARRRLGGAGPDELPGVTTCYGSCLLWSPRRSRSTGEGSQSRVAICQIARAPAARGPRMLLQDDVKSDSVRSRYEIDDFGTVRVNRNAARQQPDTADGLAALSAGGGPLACPDQ